MGDVADSDFPAALCRAQRKIGQWRRRHRPRGRIPEQLWREAAELAGAYGINRTARALRLDYCSLKKRVAVAAGSGKRVAAAGTGKRPADGARSGKRVVAGAGAGERAPAFVEFLHDGMAAARPECTIEVEDGSGVTMRIRLQGGDLPDVTAVIADVAALAGVFRRGRS